MCCVCTMAGIRHYVLRDGWKVQENNNVYHTSLPTTAMNVLIKNGVYGEDVLDKLNYRSVNKSRFNHPWRFSNCFKLPKINIAQHVFLKLDGISYSANIFVNGKLVASRDSIKGPFRQYMFDITRYVSTKNDITIEVYRANPGDPNIGFVDWNPRPADESMGIFRGVGIDVVGSVLMNNTAVQSHVNTKTLKEAWLTLATELTNLSGQTVKGVLRGELDGKQITFPVTLNAGEKRLLRLTPKEIPALHISNPRLWWCDNMGEPNLYNVSLKFDVENNTSDKCDITFGVREIDDYTTQEGYKGFLLNGKKVLIRGAGWTDDIFLRDTPESYLRQIKYVKDMHLNTIRLENIWGNSDDLFNICDRNGIMILAGWSCQWEWSDYIGGKEDQYTSIADSDRELVAEELQDQILWLRNHPSIIGWFIGSDKVPSPEMESRYRGIISTLDKRPCICSAKDWDSELSGKTGTKMAGPYEYVGPNYWYVDTKLGGAFGFNTETCIGAQLPVKESIERMIPEEKLWPVNNFCYNYHCAASIAGMHSLDVLTDIINRKFGGATDLDDYLKKADLLNYDGTRSMFEAFRVNIPHATGIIQWKLNSAWPSLYWQLYDYYGVPTAAYYSVKSGNAPQQLIYNYKDRCVYLVNEGPKAVKIKSDMSLYDSISVERQKADTVTTIEPYTVQRLFTVNKLSILEFLFLRLHCADYKDAVDNTYCLSADEDEYDWAKSTWYVSPLKTTSNFRALASLPTTALDVKAKLIDNNVEVTVTNKSNKISFFNRFMLKDDKGNVPMYAIWSDNYITLQPEETKKLTCSLSDAVKDLTLTIAGWNDKEQTIKL